MKKSHFLSWIQQSLSRQRSLHFFIPRIPKPGTNSLSLGVCSRSTRSFELDVSLALDPTTNPSYGWLSTIVYQILDSRSLYKGPTYGVTKTNYHECGTNFPPNLRGPHSKKTPLLVWTTNPQSAGLISSPKVRPLWGRFGTSRFSDPDPLCKTWTLATV